MTNEQRKEVLAMLADVQDAGTAPIIVTIGSTSKTGIVNHDTIKIQDAPPIVANKLIEAGYSLNITPDGVSVLKF